MLPRLACLMTLVLMVLSPASLRAGSSNSQLDISPDGARLLAVNPDNGTVTVVDLAGPRKLQEIAVGKKPECITWIGQGPLAAVTLYQEDAIVFLDTVQGKVVHRLPIRNEPYGIVATRDGGRLYVTHEYPGTVSEIDPAGRKVLREFKVGSRLRGLALSPDEKRLYATEFHTANLHAIDLASGQVVDTWKGQASDNLARHVVLHPRRPKAYVSHIRSRVEVNDGSGSIFPQLTVYDLVPPGSASRRKSIALDTYNGVYVVTNPWEAALSPDGKKIYTIYAGTNDMNISTVVDDDYQEIDRIGGAIRIGQNPRAVRVSPDGKTVVLWSIAASLQPEVTIHDADTMRVKGRVLVSDIPRSKEWMVGKLLFNTALPPMTSRRWIACSSCHPDGHSDARVWHNPEGLRKTPPLLGLAHTHPLHWSADRDEVQDFEYTIRGRLMQGRGLISGRLKSAELDETTRGRSSELDAIAIYCNSFEFTLSPHIPAPGQLSPAAQRGKTLFFDKTVGCAQCHSGPYYTDSTLTRPFKLHDVGTGKDDPTEKIGPKYDTPTLLGVYRSAPYLHHGKARTLHEVLTVCNKEDRHGKTSHLKPAEIADLVAFLESLPYEMPPDRTPNTVIDRLPGKK